MRSMLKRRAALLAAIVSVGGAAGALGALVSAAQATPRQEYYFCTNGSVIEKVSARVAEKLELEGWHCAPNLK